MVRLTPGVSHPKLRDTTWSPILKDTSGQAQRAVPGKNHTLRMARLTPGASHPKLSKNHMVANPKGYTRASPRGRTWEKNEQFAHGPTYTGRFPPQAFETPHGRQSWGVPDGNPRGHARKKQHFTHGPTYTGRFPSQALKNHMVANAKGNIRGGPDTRKCVTHHRLHLPLLRHGNFGGFALK